MEDIQPDIRDWSDLDKFYERPDGGPSEARIAGEKMMEICSKHKLPYQFQEGENMLTLPSDLFNACSVVSIYPQQQNNNEGNQEFNNENQENDENTRVFEVSNDFDVSDIDQPNPPIIEEP